MISWGVVVRQWFTVSKAGVPYGSQMLLMALTLWIFMSRRPPLVIPQLQKFVVKLIGSLSHFINLRTRVFLIFDVLKMDI